MHLVMFDIDGTLTETIKVDEECFARSFKDVFGFADIDTDWSHYPHTTDSGIFHDVFTARIGRSPTAQEVSQFRQHFIQLLAGASSQSPFAPVAGAAGLLSLLAQSDSHRVSLATGGWRDSASTLSNCSLPFHHSLLLHRLQGLTDCCPGSHRAARIVCPWLPEVGVIPPASRWLVPGCALTIIRRHRRMTPSTGNPL